MWLGVRRRLFIGLSELMASDKTVKCFGVHFVAGAAGSLSLFRIEPAERDLRVSLIINQ
jgi:ammonia channel protein AmtB